MSFSNSGDEQRLQVEAADAGLRLDQFLALRHTGLSRRKARVVIDIGGVFIDRKRVKVAGRKVRSGQTVTVRLGGAFERATKATGEEARSRDRGEVPAPIVRYSDRDIVVIEKPSGLLSAATPESDRNTAPDLLAAEGFDDLKVVHRLDLLTSGLLVYARSDRANRVLSAAFRDHSVERCYEVVVLGALEQSPLSWHGPIESRSATTHFQLLECFSGQEIGPEPLSLLEARLETGRQHQIRIHCRELGLAVLRDPRYGSQIREAAMTVDSAPRLALHAKRLGFEHPRTAERLVWDSAWPAPMAAWLESLRTRSAGSTTG